MPLPTDEKIIALSQQLLQQFDAIFGLNPGFRPAHAKGIMLTGTFTPSAEAATLTKAPHITRESTPVTVRFSDSTGIPLVPDNDPNANPRGFAIRFNLAEHIHTDIVSHSTDGFPTRTGQEFLELLTALATSDPKNLAGSPLEAFLGSHPKALAFVQAPKPAPSSFARESYFGATAMKFTNKDGVGRFGRYRIVPEAGNDHLDDAATAAKSANYLVDEIVERVGKGPIKFKILVQLANDGDVVDDATIHWPEDRKVLELGSFALTALVEDNAHEQKQIIFDPIPRVEGIEPSDDPLLELRAAIYLLSGRRRRAA
ncbi:catalase family peroxidase [Tunturiibacter gelidoferens]|uniref:Catalase-related peroxidase n=2 Tax=Tunturiibacter TaxID=3154218 RepID=A0A7Y9T1P1_9BACT|nr:catalase family peroxidase [Edaphobacter lichenicola]MBB5340424.1 catalase [Edaphobacter lichenicola]NYF50262.1 catalase [Edaphobacter lichenicola]